MRRAFALYRSRQATTRSNRSGAGAAWACSRGASAVEFALIVPILVSLLAGGVELAHLFSTHSQLTEIARQVARRIATGTLTEEASIELVHDQLGEITSAVPSIEVTEAELPDDTGSDITVSLSVTLADIMLLDLWPANDARLTATATMLKE